MDFVRSVQLFTVAFFQSDFLQNPYFKRISFFPRTTFPLPLPLPLTPAFRPQSSIWYHHHHDVVLFSAGILIAMAF